MVDALGEAETDGLADSVDDADAEADVLPDGD